MCSHHLYNPNSGAAGVDNRLAEALISLGLKVKLVFYDDVYSNKIAHSKWATHLFPFKMAQYFLNEHKKNKFDIVEATAGDFWLANVLLNNKNNYNRNFMKVVSTHGLEHFHLTVNNQTRNAEGKNFKKPYNIYYNLYYKNFKLWQVKQDLMQADVAIVHNSLDKRFASLIVGVNSKKINVIPWGINDNLFLYANNLKMVRNDNLLFNLIFLGRWDKDKGVHLLPQIVDKLFETDHRYRLTCAGLGDHITEDEVLAYFPIQYRSRINIISQYDNDKLQNILSQHGILIFPSVAEGFGMVIAEAMSCGLVIITTRVGLVIDWIKNEENGFIVKRRDADSYVEMIKYAVNQPELAYKIRQKAHKTALHFNWKKIAEERIKIYENYFQ
jgi:glycosyltransferase involved in cell wall biosynthesis